MAVRNGHTRVASLLLQYGSDWKHEDSSKNTPLHYAAGSGFIECIDLLIKHGADVNAENIWKVTPITIAMLNNHKGTVKRLLQEESVDVNGKDDNGRTLLSLAVSSVEEPGSVEFVKYLLDKGADPNLCDVNKKSCLHILASYKHMREYRRNHKPTESEKEQFKQSI
jgi:ankyrin repeat protein